MSNFAGKSKQSGFTLIEIAIVLVIVGLLLGGVLQGQQLIENARIRGAVNDFTGVSTAIYSYQDQYRRLPGDDGPLATLQARGGNWGTITAASTPGPNGLLAGANVGNTFTGASGEHIGLWQHLRAAGYVAGDQTIATAGAILPSNPFGGQTAVTSVLAVGLPLNTLKVCMNNVPQAAALALDTRLDDGKPSTGSFRANAGTNLAAAASNDYATVGVYAVCKTM